MQLSELRGHWALVTGASSGIGREFAVQLAAAGLNVVIVARRRELLDLLADELTTTHAVKVINIAIDLTQPGAVAGIKARLAQEEVKVRFLCNSAAFGRWGEFEKTEHETYEAMIHLNDAVMVSMCRLFLNDLSGFSSSVIVNISSPAALQPIPYMAVYAASKAFVHSFSQAIYGEWHERGVLVQCLVPGPTATEFDTVAKAYKSALVGRGSAVDVVRDSLAGLESGDPVVMSAKGTYKQRFFSGLFPARLVIRQVAKMFRPPTT